MAQQVQFVYLTQAEYDALGAKDAARLYFTSDTGRIYRGTVAYAPQRVFYGTCSTVGGTAAKVVTCPQFTSSDFVAGTTLKVKFTYTNSSTTPSITIGGSTKRIYWHGSTNPVASMWQANAIVEFIYDGTYWQMTVPQNASTTYQGTVKLNDTLTSTSTTQAATANAVKKLNDKFDAVLAGTASKADATLTERFGDWTIVVSGGQAPYPYRIAKRGDQWVLQEDLDGEGEWMDTTDPQGTPTSTLLVYDINGVTYTATRTALQGQGYILGDQEDKPLASEAEAAALRTGKADASHAHGNITSTGTLQTTDIAIANGDKLVVTDASDSNKVARTSVAFDGSTTTQYLSKKGTWQSFPTASTSTSGVVQLNDTLTSTSTTQAATANAVKQLNDKFDDYVSIADLEAGIDVDDIEANSITIDGANVATQAWVTQQIQSAITNALQTQY